MKRGWILMVALMLIGCIPGGVRDEQGRVNLGPSVFGDDPVHHNIYPSFAEFAVATHELDNMAEDGYSEAQQICFAEAFMSQVPQNLRSDLDQFARGEKALMESEYSALRKRLDRYLVDEDVMASTASEFKANCSKS